MYTYYYFLTVFSMVQVAFKYCTKVINSTSISDIIKFYSFFITDSNHCHFLNIFSINLTEISSTIERRDKENRSKSYRQFGKCGPMKRYGTLGNYRIYIITIAPAREHSHGPETMSYFYSTSHANNNNS